MKLDIDCRNTELTICDPCAVSNVIEFDLGFPDLTGESAVWLHLKLPLGSDGLLASAADAAKVKVVARRGLTDPGGFALKGGVAGLSDKQWQSDRKGMTVGPGERIRVSISEVLCKASAGTSNITVEAKLGSVDGPSASAQLTITKRRPTQTQRQDPILYFSAEPRYLIGAGRVTLRWDVMEGQEATLQWRKERQQIDPGGSAEHQVNETVSYSLTCGEHSRDVTVQVLANGWHPLDPEVFPPATDDSAPNAGFPSVVFAPASADNGEALYAIFLRHTVAGNPEAVFCKSPDGVTGWEMIDSRVPDEMVSSPGVRIADRLWLVGGSACDPRCTSDRIAFCDIKAEDNRWRYAEVVGDEGWGPRSGHACVVVGEEIVVFGGLDQYGLANNEMWVLSPENSDRVVRVKASKKESSNAPDARCFHSAAAFLKMIWIAGGVKSPNGEPCGDVWWRSGVEGSWEKRSKDPVFANSIGVGLAVCNQRLHAVVCSLSQAEGGTRTTVWTLGKLQIRDVHDQWNDSVSKPKLPPDWSSDPHSITVAGFQKRLYLRCLHRNALHQSGTASLQVHVP